MAYIRQRNGLYSFTIELPRGPNGERRQKYQGGFTKKKDAANAALAIENEIATGEYLPDSKLTVPDLIEIWLRVYKESVLVSSYVRRKCNVKTVNHYFDKILVQDLTKRMYQDILFTIVKERGNNIAKNCHTTLSLALKYAVFLDIIKRNPAESCTIPRPKIKEEVPTYLEKQELNDFLAEAKKHPVFYELFRFLAYSGCRVGEALALTWDDIDGNNVSISKSLSVLSTPTGKVSYINPPKTKSGIRTIYIDDETLSIILRLKTIHAAFKLKNSQFQTNYIFSMESGSPPYPQSVNRRFKKILKAIGNKKDLSTHKLRHTHASILAAAGISLEEIRKRLGHSRDTVTMQIYYHVTKERKSAAADLFASYMKSV